jgi:hypothetical protein
MVVQMTRNGSTIKGRINPKLFKYYEHASRNLKIPFISYIDSRKSFRFNERMVGDLGIKEWSSVMVGYDHENNIFAIKRCLGEDFGSVTLEKSGEQKICSVLSVHRRHPMQQVKYWKADIENDVVYLEPVGNNLPRSAKLLLND